MEDFRLKTFFSVANNLSFTKASQELFISQPAITRQIAKLESEYEVKFFERLGRKLKLTAAGEIFFEKTSKILKDYEDLDYTMHLLTKDQVGKLRLGASTTIAQYVLPKVLASFKHFYPKVGITMLSGNSRTIEDALKSDLLDVGFVEGIHQTQGLQYTPFLEDELKVITNNSFKAQSLTLKDFIGSPLVLRERGSGTLEVIEEALLTKQVDLDKLNVLLYLGSTEAIKSFLLNTKAFGIISGYALSNELQLGTLKVIDLEDIKFKREFMIVRMGGELKPLAISFVQFLKEYIKAQNL